MGVIENNLSNHVCFLGLQRKVEKYLRCADLFIFPVREGEGLSNSLLEAMACGLPIIASDIEANQDLLIDGNNGLLYLQEDYLDLYSKILLLHRDYYRMKNIGEMARKTILAKYSINTIAAQYNKLYHSLLLPSDSQS